MSGGGAGNVSFEAFPSFTMNTVSMPQAWWRSRWQCMNHTPAI